MAKRRPKKQKPQIVEDVGNSDDEEIDEDEAFNSEDEKLYGSFFENGASFSDESAYGSGPDGDDSEAEEGDDGEYMLNLLNNIGKDQESGKDVSDNSRLANSVTESAFSASVLPSANLTLDSLISGLEGTNGYGTMQKKLKKVSKGRATSTPLSRVAAERAKRRLQYTAEAKDISGWVEAVQENRMAETLDFRPKERMEATQDSLVEKFVPTTPFEKELHQALHHAGEQDEEALIRREEKALQDDLGSNEITIEAYRERRGELAKLRALMFYHEQKRHHMKKIKSKKYRRIRKKQKLREKEGELEAQMDGNPDLAREVQEKEEMARMKERMTLAHKNTSKWAKRVLKRGKNVDIDTRRALSAQLQHGDDLLKKMKSTNVVEDDDSDEDLAESARNVLAGIEEDAEAQPTGLFKLSFMQRGVEKQKEKAREEAQQLLMELQEDKFVAPNPTEGDQNPGVAPIKRRQKASKNEMKTVLPEGSLVASSLQFGGSGAVDVRGGIDIDLGEASAYKKPATQNATIMQTKQTASTAIQNKVQNEDESNPWCISGGKDSEARVAIETPSRRPRKAVVDVDEVVDALCTQTSKDDRREEPEDCEIDEKKIAFLTQEELVKKAFAASSQKEIEEEFAAEKYEVEENEDMGKQRKKRNKKQPEIVSGWGSWTGKGASKAGPSKRRLPAKLRPPAKTLEKRNRADAKRPNVIISEKRVKRTAEKFMISEIPYPYTSREEYERAMKGGLGKEWNVTSSVKDMTRPELLTRAGKMIQPLSKKAKRKRAPAKF